MPEDSSQTPRTSWLFGLIPRTRSWNSNRGAKEREPTSGPSSAASKEGVNGPTPDEETGSEGGTEGHETTASDGDQTSAANRISNLTPKSNGDQTSDTYRISNLTPKRIRIPIPDGDGHQWLVLAPLGTREISLEERQTFKTELRPWEQQRAVSVTPIPQSEQRQRFDYSALSGMAFLVVIFWLIGIGEVNDRGTTALVLYFVISALALAVVAIVLSGVFRHRKEGWRETRRWMAQLSSLNLTLIIGVGMPLAAVYFFGGGKELIAGDLDLPHLDEKLSSDGLALTQLGRLLQLILISVASLLPTLLFFLFDRERLGILRFEFYKEIFRLDPNMETMDQVKAKYGGQVSEIYGAEDQPGGRLLGGTRWPILVASLVITVGWILAVLAPGFDERIETPTDLYRLFFPEPNVVSFAFLGAYFFSIGMVLRRYARGDLRPKVYSQITVRIITVVILAWVIKLLWDGNLAIVDVASSDTATGASEYLLVFVFLVGIFPEVGLRFIQEAVRRVTPGFVFPSMQARHPLTNISGIDIYDRTRLFDEGITNVESLAHYKITDLLLRTRIPTERVVDWVDQAILYLHVVPDQDKNNNNDHWQVLADAGIRCATDLLNAYDASKTRGGGDHRNFLALLDRPDMPEGVHRIQLIVDSIQDDEWLSYIQYWRGSSTREMGYFQLATVSDDASEVPATAPGTGG